MSVDHVGLDFETYSAEDLPKHGAYRYMADPTFTPLIGSVYKNGQSFRFDFILEPKWKMVELLKNTIGTSFITAHNAQFEQGVLNALGLWFPTSRFIDSAVVARAVGAGSKLEAAAPQLLGIDKMETGSGLIKVFSIPGEYQEKNGNRDFDPQVVRDHPAEWSDFAMYCDLDAQLGFEIVEKYMHWLTDRELEAMYATFRMNDTGWNVDVDSVEEMLRRSNENKEEAENDFRILTHSPDLNLNSLKQLKEWCADRGIKATSFAEKPVAKLIKQISGKLHSTALGATKAKDYDDVLFMLRTKQIIGGSSLKKLPTILDMQIDGRLKGQYLHCGAGQTWRTTGKGVQMQNLKRIDGGQPLDMSELMHPGSSWDNDMLASNIRQCFTATHPSGLLLVGDFSSIEARGLAWGAREVWKLDAFRAGLDLYKVGASRQYGVQYNDVSKDQRQFGKVGELSCGYQAGGPAVKDFAAGMGVELTEAEATKIVWDWRDANPSIVALWQVLDEMLHRTVEDRNVAVAENYGAPGWSVRLLHWDTPASLLKQHPQAQSLCLEVTRPDGIVMLRRFFHGCHMRGKNIGYYKPSELKGGDLWKNWFINPKTKQMQFHQLYGGKLAGILTQSLCREIFMAVLRDVELWTSAQSHTQLIGQFHDEIVLDWAPGGIDAGPAMQHLNKMMEPTHYDGFPIAADVKSDYRYTK